MEQERKGERLNWLMDFVERNHQSKISLSDFATAEKRSMSYLSHFVKENLGQSFQEYVNTVRFQEYRQKRLCDGPGSVLADASPRTGTADSLERIYSSEESVSLFKATAEYSVMHPLWLRQAVNDGNAEGWDSITETFRKRNSNTALKWEKKATRIHG